jgi:hypothetical protein
VPRCCAARRPLRTKSGGEDLTTHHASINVLSHLRAGASDSSSTVLVQAVPHANRIR